MLSQLSIEIDANGSPVNVPASEWFVCFVSGLQKQWWHRFTNSRHQHVFAMRMLDDGCWIIVEPWWTRMLVSVLTLDEAVKFLRWAAEGDILQVREAVPGCGNQVRGWSNCAVLMAFLLGRSYRTWTPHGLYRRLVAEPDVRVVDLEQWLASHIRVVATRNVDQALEAVVMDPGMPLDVVLLQLGKGIMSGLLSRPALGLHRFAVSESSRFGVAASAYWEHAPSRAIETVRKVLERAHRSGEIKLEDPLAAARHFVAMMRGEIHLEALFGLRRAHDATEVHRWVQSAVELLLNGAQQEESIPHIPSKQR